MKSLLRSTLLLSFVLSGTVLANDLATSFEFHDSSGHFRVGEEPWIATCTGGVAQQPSDPKYAFSGSFSFEVAAGKTAWFTLPGNVAFASVEFRDENLSVKSAVAFLDANGVVFGQSFGRTSWRTAAHGGPAKFIRITNNAPDTGFVVVDDLVVGREPTVQLYCESKANACGVDAGIYSYGVPSVSGPYRFDVFGASAEPSVPGVLLYTASGPASIPFQGGTLCVHPPIHRSVPVISSSAAPCQSQFEIDWQAFAAGQLGGAPEPFLREAGQEVHLQWYGRDTASNGPYMTNGLHYRVCP